MLASSRRAVDGGFPWSSATLQSSGKQSLWMPEGVPVPSKLRAAHPGVRPAPWYKVAQPALARERRVPAMTMRLMTAAL